MNIIYIFWEGRIESLLTFIVGRESVARHYIMSGRHSS